MVGNYLTTLNQPCGKRPANAEGSWPRSRWDKHGFSDQEEAPSWRPTLSDQMNGLAIEKEAGLKGIRRPGC